MASTLSLDDFSVDDDFSFDKLPLKPETNQATHWK
jgi:hypothetical protein